MYICLCQAITKKKLCLLIKEGCHSLPKLQKKSQIGLSCGMCVKEACEILTNKTKSLDESKPKTAESNNSQDLRQQSG